MPTQYDVFQEQQEKQNSLVSKNAELRTLYKNETQREFKMHSTKSYLPKIFLDKHETEEKVNTMRERMRHSINAGDVNKLKAYVAEVEGDEALKELMKQELNFCNQRIEIITLQDQQAQ
ncbi:UNKNOWN [Stylonychia lemnae]|uniref:Uncharacterized protein n=1 Tax=Stylonychia lemnae TaxID=5949 RepID=A0A078B3C1_STYLE|nr:UNKNOWN [Stylonychia lemnae]|eukprot:CDW89025.1 UNKNOWN [Stylonychia lemnae]